MYEILLLLIMLRYKNINTYGQMVYVIFDGNKKQCTKSVERNRFSIQNISADIVFDKEMH